MSQVAEDINLTSIAEAFTPVTLDVAPLHQFLLSLSKQVEAVQQENANLKAQLDELQLPQRLEVLEAGLQGIQEGPAGQDVNNSGTPLASPRGLTPQDQQLASNQGRASPRGTTPGNYQDSRPLSRMGTGKDRPMTGTVADSGWILHEFTVVKDRLQLLEGISMEQEDQSGLAGVVERVRVNVDALHTNMTSVQAMLSVTDSRMGDFDEKSTVQEDLMAELQHKIDELRADALKAQSESVDATMKGENNVNQIWDQIRHVENSLSQRMTLAETSQVNMLQEVDETKETSLDVMARVEELRRHTTALESKLESFNSQVAAAIQPLHSSLSHVSSKLEDLTRRKQDASNAITMDDVSIAVSRAVDHADRRADNIIKSIGAMEGRVEELNDLKANKTSVVMTTDLDLLLKEHASTIDSRMEVLQMDMFDSISTKADKDELSTLDTKLAARIAALEGAILKGLKAISDKVSAALSEKLDLSRFNDFKVQVRAVLADVEDRLRDFSPAARGMKVPLDGGGNLGASSCLCCDQRVRSVKDMHASMQSTGQSTTGYGTNSRVFVPERLPSTEGLFPSINKPPDVGAYNNAKMAQQRKQNGSKMAMSRGGFDPYVSQDISEGGYAPLLPWQMSPPDSGTGPREFTKPRSTSGKVGESISGAIAEGRIPNMRGKGGAGGNKLGKTDSPEFPTLPMGPASASSSRPASADASNAAQEPHLLQLQYASQVGHKGSAGGSASQVLSNLAAPGSPGSPGRSQVVSALGSRASAVGSVIEMVNEQ